ncbi:hypothetical protein GCM10010909_05100 [Acidocella aquatica]|uniref:Uncharacterized protein n=1 Tax=Acidocella aquatica TaxID=1922313 RepID=A0ABQ6A3E2_9PROT|nr:hypothetical protein GCM10010909_05100 [Acidocella aquatica]
MAGFAHARHHDAAGDGDELINSGAEIFPEAGTQGAQRRSFGRKNISRDGKIIMEIVRHGSGMNSAAPPVN